MSTNLAAIGYLIAAVCFILALRGLSSPATARAGNRSAWSAWPSRSSSRCSLCRIAARSTYLLILVGDRDRRRHRLTSRRSASQMTAMPQLVAAFHSLVGLAAVFVAVRRLPVTRPSSASPTRTARSTVVSRLEMGLGIIIGAITFSGSVIAFGKLQAKLPAGGRERARPAHVRSSRRP